MQLTVAILAYAFHDRDVCYQVFAGLFSARISSDLRIYLEIAGMILIR